MGGTSSEVASGASAPSASTDPLRFSKGPWTLKLGLDAGTQVVGENNAFWGLADIFAPGADYKEDRVWDEVWFIPSARVDYAFSPSLGLYAGVAVAATGNVGRDIFEQGNSGRGSFEQAFGGVKLNGPGDEWSVDLSGGQQPYRLGSGMLIDLGAQNGNRRGATSVSPRKSWEYTGILRATAGRLSADAFVLNYNESTSADPDTTLAGGKLEFRLSETPGDEYLGVAYINAIDSDMPYIRAPLTVIENGRDRTQTVNPYLRVRPLRGPLPGLYLTLEGAYQWNDRVDLAAYAICAEVGYQWEDAPMRPKVSYAFRRYSGDDPGTGKLERFDPLFYDGGVHAFATGSNAALAFYNTNVQSHRLSVNLTLSPRDFVTASYSYIDAVETNSPLQFGQAGRLEYVGGQPALVSGVPDVHLSDDVYLEYVRAFSANVYLTMGLAVSVPGSGLEGLAGRSLDPWVGGLVNISFRY